MNLSRRRIENFSRQGKKRIPKRRFYLFCEGGKTEPEYFRAIKQRYRHSLIELVTVGAIGVPLTVATEAIKKKAEISRKIRGEEKSSFEKNDEVWVVFDRDDHPHYRESIRRCIAKGVLVGRSDPCFELWLLLHHVNYDKLDGRVVVQRELEKHCTEYNHNNHKMVDCEKIIEKVDDAEKRAALQLRKRKDEGDELGGPSTTVGRLTSSIRAAAQRFMPK